MSWKCRGVDRGDRSDIRISSDQNGRRRGNEGASVACRVAAKDKIPPLSGGGLGLRALGAGWHRKGCLGDRTEKLTRENLGRRFRDRVLEFQCAFSLRPLAGPSLVGRTYL
mgnify:CR=1 FL=1